ncbi:hypothetical protein GCM10010862_26960 [Devosia nitrariae]|uniref:Autotransporter domain-containing protein n=1 Tax=Devosia nitrariae TaxID=2071872 RepID=A0ABQ5W640_9HYPH|nr:hypothetical protein GCM10010862_26960 [Devosia nitrariae]
MTWYGDNGFYLDGQGQVSWFNSSLSSSAAGVGLIRDNDGFGYGLGIEAGQRIAIAPEWSLTPQAQLSYSSVTFDDFTDAFGALVSLDESHVLVGRLGFSIDRQSEWQDASGQSNRSHLYGIANLYIPLQNSSTVDVAGTSIETVAESLWGGIGVGGSLSLDDDRYAIHGEVLAKTSLDAFGESHAVSGIIGFRVKL